MLDAHILSTGEHLMTPIDVTDHLNSHLAKVSCAGEYILSVLERRCLTEVPLLASLVLHVTTMDMVELDFKGAERIVVV